MGPGKETQQLRNKLKNKRTREPQSVVPIRPVPKKKKREYIYGDASKPLFAKNPVVEASDETVASKSKKSRIKKIIDVEKFNVEAPSAILNKTRDMKQNKMVLRVIIYLVFLAVIGLLFYVITPVSNLKSVTVVGNSQLDYREVYALTDMNIGDKMYFIQSERVAEKLKKTPLIDDAIVTKEGFGDIHIHILEERTVGYLPSDDGFYPVQESGYMILDAVNAPTLGPLLYHFDADNIAPMLSALGGLSEDVVASISEIYARPTGDNKSRIQLYMNDGQVVIADIDTLSDKFSYYTNMRSEIEDSTAGVIDLEVGNSFLPYTSTEARELMASIYGESVSQAEREQRDALVEPLKSALEGFSEQ